jgi:flavin-dependent dehydrogenase
MLAGAPVTRDLMMQRMAALLPGLAEPDQLRAHRLPLSPGRPRVADGRIMLAGDALSLINPLSGEGIFYAVLSGSLSGAASGEGRGAGSAYRAAMRRSLRRHLRSTDIAARLTRAPRFIDAGVRAAARSRPVFDDLVRMSLGDGALTPRLMIGLARSLHR